MKELEAFRRNRFITSDADGARYVTAADIDNDGDVDVLSASSRDSTVAWYENLDGRGDFEQDIVSLDARGASAVFAGDLDLDGDVDVLSASIHDDTIAYYENRGGGTFRSRLEISTDAQAAQSVVAADLNGDGRPDVLSASREDDKVAFYLQSATAGVFGEEQLVTNASQRANHVTLADLDGDGNDDLLVVADAYVGWYANLTQGEFGPLQQIATNVPGGWWVDAGDADGDGDLDVFISSIFDDSISWLENEDGLGNFGARLEIDSGNGFSHAVELADVDGDDDLDVLATTGIGRVTVFENFNGDGFFVRRVPTPWSDRAIALHTADLNNDGNLDLITTHADGIRWHTNNDGFGFYTKLPQFAGSYRSAESVFAADVDADGDIDILAASSQENAVGWFENVNGRGDFAPVRTIDAFAEAGIDGVYAADIDGDGDLDVVAAASDASSIAWFENRNGKGNFGAAQLISNQAQNAGSLDAADVDQDGDLDLFYASFLAEINGDLVWYENRLQGDVNDDDEVSFADFVILSSHFGRTDATTAQGDLNGDRRIDFRDFLLLANNFGAKRPVNA